VLTALLWLTYIYLVFDIFRVAADTAFWLIGWGLEPRELRAILAFLSTLGSYAAVVVANAAVLLGWALYNRLRFRGLDRRQTPPPVGPADFAAMYDVSVEDVAAWQQARILVVHHDETGKLTGIEMPKRGPSGLAAG
jgi:biofilm PGA synthesis protein PgaD